MIASNVKKVKVKEYLAKELERAGIGEIDIQRTPLETRVIIYAQRPGIVIGKKGLTIKSLTETLAQEYEIYNPQIEVNDLGVPALSAPVMAKSIASSLERGFHFRRAAYQALNDIMNAGAIGAQITISGKLTGERSRTEKFVKGYIKHCGEPSETLVLKGFAEAAPKLGRIGVKVKILPPGAVLPDDIKTKAERAKEKMGIAEVRYETVISEEKAAITDDETASDNILDGTAKDILTHIGSMNESDLTALLEEEILGKNRKTVVDGIKKLMSGDKKSDTAKEKTESPKVDFQGILGKPAKEILKDVKTLDAASLQSILKLEEKGNNRKTVIEGIKKLIPEG